MIYFIQSVDGGPIKIGFSGRLSERLAYLRLETGENLEVLAILPGGRKEEKSLHRQFVHIRAKVRRSREHFHPEDELLEFIAKNGQPWDGADDKPKRIQTGKMIRVSDECAEILRKASGLHGISIAVYCDRYLLPIVRAKYRDAVLKKARELETMA